MIEIYYRPEWTCGRYIKDKATAIYYNLIEGMAYLFEDDSAEIVGWLLDVERNGKLSIFDVAKDTNTAVDCLEGFLEELVNVGLLTTSPITKAGIADYRQRMAAYRCHQIQTTEKTTKEKLPMEISNVEMDFMERVGGVCSVMLELTYNCSEKCIHCYNIGATRNDAEVSHRGDREELTLEDYRRIIDELYDEGLFKVCLSGGDPFSKSIAWDIIDYLCNKGIAFDIFTNGQRIVNQIERLANYYPRVVGVSIYSGEPNEHDFITRIKGSWERSMAVVRGLSALAVPLNLKCCVMRPNVKNYYKVADIAKEYGAYTQFEVNLSDSVDGDKCVSQYLRLTPDLLEIVLRDDNIPMYVGKEAPNFGGQKRLMDRNPCGAGQNTFCITPDGNLIPCCSFHAVFGNLKESSINTILENSVDFHKWNSLKLENYEECGRYDYCDYCNLCPGLNHSEHGTPLKAGENNCYMAKIRYELAHKMMKGYDPLNGKSLIECLQALPDYIVNQLERKSSHDYSDKSLIVGG